MNEQYTAYCKYFSITIIVYSFNTRRIFSPFESIKLDELL